MLGRADFEGHWRLERQIDDRRAGQTGTFRGSANLRAAGEDALHYAEAGQMKLGQGPLMTAERRYHWQIAPDLVIVSFDDGRPFHSFRPEGTVAGTDHPCGEDFYTVRYDFSRWPRWEAIWTVRGPRKDYTSTSVYTRA